MAINVGDAVLTFLGDTTNLDQAFERVNNTSKARLAPVSNTIQDIGGQWQFTGRAASTAGESAESAAGMMEEAGNRGSKAFHATRESVDLLSHEFGITLPRELKGFLAELGPVQGLLAGAFEGVAVFALIAAIVEGTEKLSEWIAETFIFTEAMRRVADINVEVNKSIQSQREEIDKLQNAYNLLGLTGTAKVAEDFRQLSVNADKAESDFRRFADQAYGVKNGLVSLGDTIGRVNDHIKELNPTLSPDDLKKKFLPDDATREEVLRALESFITDQKAVVDKFEQSKLNIQKQYDAAGLQEQIANGQARIEAEKTVGAARVELVLQQTLLQNSLLRSSYLEDAKAQQEANQQKFQNAQQSLREQLALAQQRLEGERAAADAQRAFIKEGDPQAVQKNRAIDAELESIARQHAGELININAQIEANEKEHEASLIQQRQTFNRQIRSLLEESITPSARILSEEFNPFPKPSDVDAVTTAINRLNRAEIELGQAQKNLAQSTVRDGYNAQEQAITKLADFRVISEEQKTSRLRDLYAQEEKDALSSLTKLLAQEKSLLDVAQEKVTQSLGNPFLTDEQRINLEENLTKIETAYTNTQAEITRVTEEYGNKRAALLQGQVAVAVALANSEGRVTLARDLEENQTKLDLINRQIQLARARGEDTTALQKQQKATEDIIKSEVKEAQGTRALNAAMVELKQTMVQAAQGELLAFGTAMAAAIAGQESFGKAMEAGTLRVISSLAQQWAEYYFALAIADAFWDPVRAAGEFAAAVALEAVAGVTSGLASSIDSSASNDRSPSTPDNLPPTQQTPATTAEPNPVQVVNVQRFAVGGMVTSPMLAIVGDSRGGGRGREVIFPLDDDQTVNALNEKLGGRGETHNHFHFPNLKGILDVKDVMKAQTRAVKRGTGRTTSSESLRNSRRA